MSIAIDVVELAAEGLAVECLVELLPAGHCAGENRRGGDVETAIGEEAGGWWGLVVVLSWEGGAF